MASITKYSTSKLRGIPQIGGAFSAGMQRLERVPLRARVSPGLLIQGPSRTVRRREHVVS
jgi:hypothetical protein